MPRPLRRLRPRHAFLALVLSLVGFAAPASAGAFQAGVNMIDIVVPESTYHALQNSGAHFARAFMGFNVVEPQPGHYDQFWLNAYDNWVNHLTALGIQPVIDVVGAPSWASGSSQAYTLPTDPTAFGRMAGDYGAFMSFMAHRYAGRVKSWEIWNEEDATAWWPSGPNPGNYVQLLKGAYSAVKAADPSANVILGGLTGNDATFLSQVYAAGGAGSFDTVGVHTDTACNVISPYRFQRDANGISQYSFLGYRSVKAVMDAHGDAAKGIWMTEMGWSTVSKVCDSGRWAGQKAGGVTDAAQADYLAHGLHCLSQDSSTVPVGIVFSLSDGTGAETKSHYGLLNASGAPKPAFGTFSTFNRSGDQVSGPCGSSSGPTISPSVPSHYTRLLTFRVTASVSADQRAASGDPGLGIGRIEAYYDKGQKIRGFSDTAHGSSFSASMTWFGAEHLANGPHTLTLVAYDTMGNQSTVTVPFIRGSGATAAAQGGAGKHAKHHRSRKHAKKSKHHRAKHARRGH